MKLGKLDKILSRFKGIVDNDVYMYAVVAQLPLRIRIYDLANGKGVDLCDWTFLSLEKDTTGAFETLNKWERPWNKLKLYIMLWAIGRASKSKAMAIEAERVLVEKGIRRPKEIQEKPLWNE